MSDTTVFDKSDDAVPVAPSLRPKTMERGKEYGGKILAVRGLKGGLFARVYQPKSVTTPPRIKTWDKEPWNGKEGEEDNRIEQIIVTVQTSLRDPDNPADGGARSFYIERKSLWTKEGNNFVRCHDTMWGALLLALEKAGTPKDIRKDGELYYAIVGTASVEGTDNDRYLWRARYVPPAMIAGVFDKDSAPPAESSNGNGQGVHDAVVTQRAALKLEIIGAETKQVLGALFEAHHGTPVWTEELHELAMQRKAALEQPAPVASNPFL